jgi:hypothetical protein
LRPVDRAIKYRRCAPQFMLADLFSLTTHVAIPFAIGANLGSIDAGGASEWRQIVALLVLCVVVIWWGGVQAISSAGVQDPWRRNLFVALILPLAYASICLANPAAVLGLVIVEKKARAAQWLIVLTVCSLVTPLLVRWGLKWVLADPSRVPEQTLLDQVSTEIHPLDAGEIS